MIYALMGYLHAAVERRLHRIRTLVAGETGQGTVEYVGLILLVAVILAGVVKASGSFSDKGIADAVVKKLKAAIDGVGK
jgi:hypothetical protein